MMDPKKRKASRLAALLIGLAMLAGAMPLSVGAATAPMLQLVTEAKWDEVGPVSEGAFWVRQGSLFTYLDLYGRQLMPMFDPYRLILSGEAYAARTAAGTDDVGGIRLRNFHDGLAAVTVEGESVYGVFIDKTGAVLDLEGGDYDASWGADTVYVQSDFNEGLANISVGQGDCTFIGTDGRRRSFACTNLEALLEKAPAGGAWDIWAWKGGFSDGLTVGTIMDYETGETRQFYMAANGTARLAVYESAHPYRDGYAAVEAGGKWGIVDRNGAYAIQPTCDDFIVYDAQHTFQVVKDGYAIVQRGDKFEAASVAGRSAVTGYESISAMSGGLFLVSTGGRFGYADATGRIVVPTVYRDANLFANGAALVSDGTAYFLIDRTGAKTGRQTWAFDTTLGSPVSPEFIRFEQNGLAGMARVVAASAIAVYADRTASSVTVDGAAKSFDAYRIGGSNYFRLRDLAMVLDGTAKQFSVDWSAESQAIALAAGADYSPVGGEMTAAAGSATVAATPSTAKVVLDGRTIALTAYNINGSNYFKLRDLGRALDFGVEWNAAENRIDILSTTGYSE